MSPLLKTNFNETLFYFLFFVPTSCFIKKLVRAQGLGRVKFTDQKRNCAALADKDNGRYHHYVKTYLFQCHGIKYMPKLFLQIKDKQSLQGQTDAARAQSTQVSMKYHHSDIPIRKFRSAFSKD